MAIAFAALGPVSPVSPEQGPIDPRRDAELRENAKAFEAVFVAQMLAHTGLTEALSADGGFGGEAFSSLLIEQYAGRLVEQGGFGLADDIYSQLRERDTSNAGTIS